MRQFVAYVIALSILTACTAPVPTPALGPVVAPTSSIPAAMSTPPAAVTATPSRPTVVVSDPFIVAAQYLGNGEFSVPAANAAGEPGYHEPFSATLVIPKLDPAKGKRFIVALRDLLRPDQQCASDDSRSGCATVDWSDDPSRPKVPQSGVFDNSITLQLASGPRTFYLTASGALADQPDKSDPSHPQSALSGRAREWSVILPDDLVSGSALKLNLTLKKLGAPNVRIAYEIRVQPTR